MHGPPPRNHAKARQPRPGRPFPNPPRNPAVDSTRILARGFRYAVLDLETRRSAQDVGGWHRAWMGVSCVIVLMPNCGQSDS